ncbi:MAG: hypothetical protein IKP50_00240 [Bacilli bacterium]|nr:hypothetical protein [Bacilli bacterium]
MKVVRVNDFDIPSDENDYDELVAFADTMASIEQFEAIPKDQYEARLKADMVAMLTEIQLEIEDTGAYEQEVNGKTEYLKGINYAYSVIQQKINELKENKDGSNNN